MKQRWDAVETIAEKNNEKIQALIGFNPCLQHTSWVLLQTTVHILKGRKTSKRVSLPLPEAKNHALLIEKPTEQTEAVLRQTVLISHSI